MSRATMDTSIVGNESQSFEKHLILADFRPMLHCGHARHALVTFFSCKGHNVVRKLLCQFLDCEPAVLKDLPNQPGIKDVMM